MAKIIHYDGRIEDVEPVNGEDFKLEQLQAIVGGYIEVVRSQAEGDDRIMVVDEEGKIKEKFYNAKATDVLINQFGYMNDFIAGDALVCREWQIN